MLLNPRLALPSPALACAPALQAKAHKCNTVAAGGGGFVTGVIPANTGRGLFYSRTDVPLPDWQPATAMGFMGAEFLAVDPNNAGHIYLAVGTSYFNGGKSAISTRAAP